jgi:hypothetical protein
MHGAQWERDRRKLRILSHTEARNSSSSKDKFEETDKYANTQKNERPRLELEGKPVKE